MLKKHKNFKPDKNVDIKESTENWQNKLLDCEKSIYNKNISIFGGGDRFIPRRYLNGNIETNKKFFPNQKELNDILVWDLPKNYWAQKNMVQILDDVFFIKCKRVLQFNQETNNDCNESKRKIENASWKCKARQKRWAYCESTHDFTHLISGTFECNKMDWSINGQIVGSFEDEVVVWKNIREISLIFHVDGVSCLAYSPNGKYLAIGCKIAKSTVIEFWDVNNFNVFFKVHSRCIFKSESLKIECLEWSKCGRFLVAGTNKGIIYVLSMPRNKIIKKIYASKSKVVKMRFSTTMRYLAVGDADGEIMIFHWSSLNIFYNVVWANKNSVLFDWHPWRIDDLAIAKSHNKPTIAILNVPSKTVKSLYRRDCCLKIDSIAFNKITAELCIGISRVGPEGYTESKIIVLESFNRIVDILAPEYGARFLVWDPSGTRLATAGNDNSWTIWKFHPDIEKKNRDEFDPINKKLKQKLFYGCDRNSQFKFWSNIR